MQPSLPLHVTFTLSGRGTLVEALRASGRPDEVIGLPDDLSLGPISPMDHAARLEFLGDVLGYETDEDDIRKIEAFWRTALDSSRRRIVWLSQWSTQEYCGFLEWLHRNGDAPFELVDLTDAVMPHHIHQGEWEPVPYTAIMRTDQFIEADFWSKARPAEPDKMDAWRGLWERLRDENAPLRAIRPDGLVSADLDYFDSDLLRQVGADWIDARRVVGEVLVAIMYDCFRPAGVRQAGDILLFSRLRTLVEEGVLESKGKLWGAAFKVRRPRQG